MKSYLIVLEPQKQTQYVLETDPSIQLFRLEQGDLGDRTYVSDRLVVFKLASPESEASVTVPGKVGEGEANSNNVAAQLTCFYINLCLRFCLGKLCSLALQLSIVSETALFESPPIPQPSGVSPRLGHIHLLIHEDAAQEHLLTQFFF